MRRYSGTASFEDMTSGPAEISHEIAGLRFHLGRASALMVSHEIAFRKCDFTLRSAHSLRIV